MSLLRRLFRVERPSLTITDTRDPEEDKLIEQQNQHINEQRQELRAKLQKVKTESSVLSMAGGALKLMEADRGRR